MIQNSTRNVFLCNNYILCIPENQLAQQKFENYGVRLSQMIEQDV